MITYKSNGVNAQYTGGAVVIKDAADALHFFEASGEKTIGISGPLRVAADAGTAPYNVTGAGSLGSIFTWSVEGGGDLTWSISSGGVLTIPSGVAAGTTASIMLKFGDMIVAAQQIVIEAAAPVARNLSISTTGATVTVKRGGEDVSAGNTIYDGNVLTISASATEGYQNPVLTVNGSTFTSGSTHTVSGNVSITATAEIQPQAGYTITYIHNGLLDVSGMPTEVAQGGSVTITPAVKSESAIKTMMAADSTFNVVNAANIWGIRRAVGHWSYKVGNGAVVQVTGASATISNVTGNVTVWVAPMANIVMQGYSYSTSTNVPTATPSTAVKITSATSSKLQLTYWSNKLSSGTVKMHHSAVSGANTSTKTRIIYATSENLMIDHAEQGTCAAEWEAELNYLYGGTTATSPAGERAAWRFNPSKTTFDDVVSGEIGDTYFIATGV